MGSLLLGCAWLLPNHYEPWTSMQSDAWVAVWFFFVFLFLISKKHTTCTSTHFLLILSCATVPWFQYWGGILLYSGQAWIASAYIGGAAMAFWAGEQWRKINHLDLGDVIFMAIGIASITSVGINICQWLALVDSEPMSTWIMAGSPLRSSSNLAQANQTGTLLVWGIAAQIWGMARQKVREPVALLAIIWLLFGIILTQSRTAILELATVTALMLWHQKDIGIKWKMIAILSGCMFAASLLLIFWPHIDFWLGSGERAGTLERMTNEPRPTQWLMFLQGAMLKPWLGYGWNQVAPAQLALEHTPAGLNHMLFAQSHNIFIDLILWCGFPLGIAISFFLLIFSLKCILRRIDSKKFPFCIIVSSFGIHSLLEYPFHYIYFLFPAMMALGLLNENKKKNQYILENKLSVLPLVGIYAVVGALLISDAFRLEDSWRSVRLRILGFWIAPENEKIPDLPMLSHMRQVFLAEKYQLRYPMPDQDIIWLKSVVNIFPSSLNMLNLSAALALQGRPDESRSWYQKICTLSPAPQCAEVERRWQVLERQFPQLSGIH